MKKIITIIPAVIILLIWACGGGSSPESTSNQPAAPKKVEKKRTETEDASRGFGKFKDVELNATLDHDKAEKGQTVYDVKCSSCHRLSGPRLVGPSWEGVTKKRKPEWILNFITNVDEMLEKDPVAMAQLEECLIRMPNQNLSDEDAFAVLEFMRKNDGVN